MAYIKIFPIKVTVKKAIDYITNPDKTDEALLVSAFGCSPETADIEFAITREQGKNNVMDKGDNLAFHLIQSFKPDEVDAETAHDIGKKFADSVLRGKYEYVLSTHVDKGHIHNHIIFNATSFVDYHKYVSNKRSYHRICRTSNQICREYGLSENMPTNEKGKSYKENMEYHRGNSWKAKLKAAVDKAIWSSISYEEFLQKMHLAGYDIRQGKHLAFRAPEQTIFTIMKSLVSYYSEENVRQRLEKNRHRLKIPRNTTREVRIFIDISTYVTTGNRAGFERWANLNNLKEAAKTFNYLSENNLLNYDDFQQHCSDISDSISAASSRLENLEKQISEQSQLRKQCIAYRNCRQIIEKETFVSDKKRYRDKHERQYQFHDSIKKELLQKGIKKIPSDEKLSSNIASLENERNTVIAEKQKLVKQQKTLSTVQQNFEALLNAPAIFNSQQHSEEKSSKLPVL